jgi:hypothetical protein
MAFHRIFDTLTWPAGIVPDEAGESIEILSQNYDPTPATKGVWSSSGNIIIAYSITGSGNAYFKLEFSPDGTNWMKGEVLVPKHTIGGGGNSLLQLSGVTQAAEGVFTANNVHYLRVGDKISFTSVNGMTDIDDKTYFIKEVLSPNTFKVSATSLSGVPGSALNTSGFAAWTSGGVFFNSIIDDNVLSVQTTTCSYSPVELQGDDTIATGQSNAVSVPAMGRFVRVSVLNNNTSTGCIIDLWIGAI